MGEIKEFVRKTISLGAITPEENISVRAGAGGKTLRYVTGAYVIGLLNTNTEWDFVIDRVDFITAPTKKEGVQFPTVIVIGTLIIPELGKRTAIGASSIENAREIDKDVKTAMTNSLKKAATLFGVGLDLWEESAASEIMEIKSTDIDGMLENKDLRQYYLRVIKLYKTGLELSKDSFIDICNETIGKTLEFEELKNITNYDEFRKIATALAIQYYNKFNRLLV